jgi:hypothetical protein
LNHNQKVIVVVVVLLPYYLVLFTIIYIKRKCLNAFFDKNNSFIFRRKNPPQEWNNLRGIYTEIKTNSVKVI